MTDKYLDGTYQRKVGEMVDREVVYNVSMLISDLAKNDAGEYWDDILSVCVCDDYETPAWDAGWRVKEDTNGEWFASGSPDSPHDSVELPDADSEQSAWRELCDQENIDPYQDEAYEHWIVSDWLAGKLEAQGEMISKDIHSLTLWGRTTSGQAILLDRVICDIYDALHKDDVAA